MSKLSLRKRETINSHMCLKTFHLKFLDITNYLSPGFSYEQFLNAYECSQNKGFFPYEYADSLEKLNDHVNPADRKSCRTKPIFDFFGRTRLADEHFFRRYDNHVMFCDIMYSGECVYIGVAPRRASENFA